jgi:UTP--glucose-1-phosphate uridylyltransferase
MQIRKAVIPAAGLGTRLLPATKSLPKEMLPIADQPTIQYVVEEAVAAGVRHITMVTSRGKRAMEDYFDAAPELRALLEQKRDLVGDEPFGVLLGDDLVLNDRRPCLGQLMEVHARHGGCVLAVMRVPREHIGRYGIVAVVPDASVDQRTHRVSALVEKPSIEEAPSNLAVIGRYVLAPEVFDALAHTAPGRGGEIQLTDALHTLAQRQPVYAYEFEGTRFDTGDPVGLLTTSIAYALLRHDLAPDLRSFLRTLALE